MDGKIKRQLLQWMWLKLKFSAYECINLNDKNKHRKIHNVIDNEMNFRQLIVNCSSNCTYRFIFIHGTLKWTFQVLDEHFGLFFEQKKTIFTWFFHTNKKRTHTISKHLDFSYKIMLKRIWPHQEIRPHATNTKTAPHIQQSFVFRDFQSRNLLRYLRYQ